MPPLSTSPLMLDLGVYLMLPIENVPSATCEPSETSTLTPVSVPLDGVETVEASRVARSAPIAPAARKSAFSSTVIRYREAAPPEFISCALALRTLAHIGRLKREGRELRRKRLAAGLSKGQAARLCGVSRREYGRWESGEERAPEGVVQAMGRGTR